MASLKDILAVDGGRSYIEHRFPDSVRSFDDKRRKFKVREEKTPSASVYQKDGTWYVTDFGGEQKRMHAIDLTMFEDGCEFIEALNKVATFYGLSKGGGSDNKPEIDKWPAKPEEAEGDFDVKYKEFDMFELKTLFAEYAWRAMGKNDDERKIIAIQKCKYLHYKAIESYRITKDGVTIQYSSNESFPMFAIDEGSWKKIYKPKAEKQYRFFSRGEKPQNFIHGLEQLTNFVADKRGSSNININIDDENDGKKKSKSDNIDFKVDKLIICTGGSDALNVHALGYHVVWLNSESAELTRSQYKIFKEKSWNVFNLPDIDETGKREAHSLALEYLDILTIRLPEELKKHKDHRGNACKDIRDYLKYHTKYDFDQLVKVAIPYQFWDQEQKLDKDGEPVFKFKKPVTSYVFNNVRAYNFLFHSGFSRYKSEKEKEGFFFIKIDGHVVRRVETSEIRDFINGFLESRFMPEDLRNIVYRSPQLSETSLANLPLSELDFQPYDAETQYYFFQTYNVHKRAYDGSVWKITKNGIEEVKGAGGKYVWQEKVIERKINILPKFFKSWKDDHWDIEIVDDSPMVLRFLVQTCRVHWRKELEERLGICSRLKTDQERKEYASKHSFSAEDFERVFTKDNRDGSKFIDEYREKYKFSLVGSLLTEAEQIEQKLHFLNRLYAIGYLLHRYKNPSKPWGVWVMDNKISDEGESHGGSGKSLLVKLLIYMNLITVPLDGRNARLTDNPHIFENVDFSTDLINTDDCYDYFNFGYFYASLTSDLSANPKNKKGYTIPFDKSPKFIFSSNYGDRQTDPSSLRRKLYTVYSDYYHENNGEYNETRKPDEEFGRNLFTDWKHEDWEHYYNFMGQCLAFYLQVDEKIVPPMGNVMKRNMIAEMTESFKAWADSYFSLEGDRVNDWYRKDIAFEDFKRETGLKNSTATSWKKKLGVYCKYMKYELNPHGMGSTTRKVTIQDDYGKPKETSKEFIYIQTNSIEKKNAISQNSDRNDFPF